MRRTSCAAAVTLLLLAAAVSCAASEWKIAEGSRRWSFPHDHGVHSSYRTEWWYFTGQLRDPSGLRLGYQLTFFRFGARSGERGAGAWAVRDIYAAHFALVDLDRESFSYAERISREGPGLAGAGAAGLEVTVLDWSAATDKGDFVLTAREGGMRLELRLRPREEPLLHGSGGLSRKGERPGQASWYYSMTELAAAGEVTLPGRSSPVRVEGWTWFDHEFGSNQLSPDQVGWDWFALRLDDGRRVMLYLLRRRDGTVEPFSSGTLRETDGTVHHLFRDEFSVKTVATWKSGQSGAEYPSAWRIRIPSAAIDLSLAALAPDQELITSASTGVTYWEGAAGGEGSSDGAEVSVEGYVELTGYGGSLGGLF